MGSGDIDPTGGSTVRAPIMRDRFRMGAKTGPGPASGSGCGKRPYGSSPWPGRPAALEVLGMERALWSFGGPRVENHNSGA